MRLEYKSLTGIELIKGFCLTVMDYGVRNGLGIDGIKIWLHPRVAESMKLDEFLSVKYENFNYEIPIIKDVSAIETSLIDGRFQSDIRVGNPDWKINMEKGELW